MTGGRQVKTAHHSVGVRGEQAHPQAAGRGAQGLQGLRVICRENNGSRVDSTTRDRTTLPDFCRASMSSRSSSAAAASPKKTSKMMRVRPRLGQALNEAGVVAPGPGPGMSQGAEGGGVDADDENLPGRGGRRPQAAAQVQGKVLQGAAQVMGRQGHHHEPDRHPQSQGTPQGVLEDFRNKGQFSL
jgi:hypothetical protein